ncbi:hypothetical protein [Jiella marina]|uniref:hypothetical protein n=1 Tax=Jiella sp. LLJ827 TaxID=2917712 RepID=UPI0021008C24|nr:hypothetical protein [Jiella sp. LLJ827]MCQ0988530.1 hypothetical protein [Jiella sp. LLJ827]
MTSTADPTLRPSYGRTMIDWFHAVFRSERGMVAGRRADDLSPLEYAFGDGMAGPGNPGESPAGSFAVLKDEPRTGPRPIRDIDQLYAVAQAAGSTIVTNGDDDAADLPLTRHDPEAPIRVRKVDDRS